jgi:hypothetical protein
VAQYKFISAMAMCAGCHRGNCVLVAALEIVSVFRMLNHRQRGHRFRFVAVRILVMAACSFQWIGRA